MTRFKKFLIFFICSLIFYGILGIIIWATLTKSVYFIGILLVLMIALSAWMMTE